jgi:molybdopterin synthase catalytic subunit
MSASGVTTLYGHRVRSYKSLRSCVDSEGPAMQIWKPESSLSGERVVKNKSPRKLIG